MKLNILVKTALRTPERKRYEAFMSPWESGFDAGYELGKIAGRLDALEARVVAMERAINPDYNVVDADPHPGANITVLSLPERKRVN